MGYGTLLFGYFLTYAFSLSRVYFFTDIIGALVMLWAFSKLIAYNRYYRGAAASGIVFTALCLTGCVAMFARYQPEWFTLLLNCLKADYNRIFKNEIITDIIKLLGDFPGRFVGTAGLNASKKEEAIDEIERTVLNGPLKGVSMEPGALDKPMYADDPRIYPIYEKCE